VERLTGDHKEVASLAVISRVAVLTGQAQGGEGKMLEWKERSLVVDGQTI
jgi:hypothetical protein